MDTPVSKLLMGAPCDFCWQPGRAYVRYELPWPCHGPSLGRFRRDSLGAPVGVGVGIGGGSGGVVVGEVDVEVVELGGASAELVGGVVFGVVGVEVWLGGA